MKKKALIAMSGGVDSSVSAALMCERGYECVGGTMRLYHKKGENSCTTTKDIEDARRVATELGMPFYVYDFSEAFSQEVISRFIDTYKHGGTPNPCIECNRYMKQKRLYDEGMKLGCDLIVTGHYARVTYDETDGRYHLKKAVDLSKDQSYVLYFYSQEQLSHTMFPLGDFHSKDEIRELAAKHGFINAHKHDSQDICFIPEGDYGDFIEETSGEHFEPGDFVDENGNVLGTHKGIIRYTIGQRKGLGLALPTPMYVCRKDIDANAVVLTTGASLYSDSLIADNFNWIYPEPSGPIHVTAKTRYKAAEVPATAEILGDGHVVVRFDKPERAISPGQAVVLYDGDDVVGGGTIVCAGDKVPTA